MFIFFWNWKKKLQSNSSFSFFTLSQTILLGPGGTTINWIKEKATEDLEKFFQKNVKLTIHLKVQH